MINDLIIEANGWMRVKNIHNLEKHSFSIYDLPKEFLTWRAYWEAKTGRRFGQCSCIECEKEAEFAARIVSCAKEGSYYLVPLCHLHYIRSIEFVINKADVLIIEIDL